MQEQLLNDLLMYKNHDVSLSAHGQALPNCPLHPTTNDLPPGSVADALTHVETYLSTVINSTSLVRMFTSLLSNKCLARFTE